MVTETMTPAEGELRAILAGITREYGEVMAQEVARTLLAAVVEGRIDGSDYATKESEVYDEAQNQWVRVPPDKYEGCLTGHMAQALDSWEEEVPDLPVWTRTHEDDGDLSPLERLVLDVRAGQTPATAPALAAVQSWLTTYLAA